MIADPHITAIRSFNRFYTRAIGTLEEHLLQSSLSLPEARVLYEIATRTQPTASEIAATLNLDLGYLSRILRNFIDRKLITRKTSPTDARQSFLFLTKAGQKEFTTLNQRSNQQVEQMIAPFTEAQRTHLVQAMSTIETILSPSTTQHPFVLRPHRPGDMGWVIQSHGLFYAREYGWDERFEALVARITADFIDNFDPTRERCWVAERNGESIGSVFLVKDKQSRTNARLRLLLVDPSARGLGLGRTLIRECTLFARNAGYRKITLWTNSILDAARRLYQAEGYHLIGEETHHSFGKKLTGQTWQLDL